MGSRNASQEVYPAPHVLFFRQFPLFHYRAVFPQAELDFARFLPHVYQRKEMKR